MPLTLDEATTPLTPEDVKKSLYDVLAALGTNTTTWKPVSVVRTIIAGLSIVVASLSELIAQIAKSGWLELAEGDWLTLVARYVYKVERVEASFATGAVTLTNTGGGVFDWEVGDLIVKNTIGKTFRNTQILHLGALGILHGVTIEAIEAGSGSTSGAGAIDSFETTGVIGLTVTNPTALVGLDEQTDPELRLVCNEMPSSLSPNGARGAYAFFAKQAKRTDGGSAGVTRVAVSKSSTTGQVTVTVGGPSGPILGTADDPATNLGAVDLAIKQNVVPDAVTETTESAIGLTIPVTCDVWIYAAANVSSADLRALIVAKLVAFMTSQPIGGNVIGLDAGKVFVDAIRTVIGAARPEIFHVTLAAPAADVVVAPSEIPLLGAVTVTMHTVIA